jgi:large subunit ribosomal protein L25
LYLLLIAYYLSLNTVAKLSLKVQPRKILGRKVKQLRRKGVLPANVYGKKVKSKAVKVDLVDFQKIFKSAGETNVVELILASKKLPVLIHNVQYDPVGDNPIHADFLKVDLREKVTANVPVELVGEAPAEKQALGTLVQYVDEVEVEALPKDLPNKFEVDLTRLEKVDNLVQIKDIQVDKKKVEVKDEDDKIIVKIEPLRKEEEIPVPTEEPTEEEEKPEEVKEVEGKPTEEVEEKKEPSVAPADAKSARAGEAMAGKKAKEGKGKERKNRRKKE